MRAPCDLCGGVCHHTSDPKGIARVCRECWLKIERNQEEVEDEPHSGTQAGGGRRVLYDWKVFS